MSRLQASHVDVPRRCLDSLRDMFRDAREPMRHLHIVDARPEWGGILTPALGMLCERGEVVVMQSADGYARYALAYHQPPMET